MVYVVERYLPGLHRSDLLRGLLRLEQGSEEGNRGANVRYLDSTIVLRDEACFCRFEGPSSAAVAEVNRQAGLPFDRIVAAVTVNPKGAEMSTYPSIPATVEIKRGRLFGLVVRVAALAAAVTWVLSAYAFDNGSSATSAVDGAGRPGLHVLPRPAPGYGDRHARSPGLHVLPGPAHRRGHDWGSLDHVRDTGWSRSERARNWLRPPECPQGPSVESVLASMSPQTREYTKRIMNLTFAQLAAGAAGHP